MIVLAAAACTTTGVGTGQVVGQNVGATFTWTESGGSGGNMVAQLSNGEMFQGPFFQITSETVADYDPLWHGWGPGWWLGRRLRRQALGLGLGRLGSVGSLGDDTVLRYSGQVLANLQGSGGFMRCDFRLMRPSSGMAGGGAGPCQLPTGTIINPPFPRGRGY